MHLCVSYPNLTASDQKRIDDFRRVHDLDYVDVIDPHWTMIFPSSCEGISEQQLTEHIRNIASQYSPIDFICRHALVYDDDSNDNYYIFLVPDEGFSGISQLHDALYTDFMRTKLRLDIPFIPHIGIATHKDRDHLYALAQEWNAERHEIRGVIDSLSLCSYNDSKVDDIQTFQLGMRD